MSILAADALTQSVNPGHTFVGDCVVAWPAAPLILAGAAGLLKSDPRLSPLSRVPQRNGRALKNAKMVANVGYSSRRNFTPGISAVGRVEPAGCAAAPALMAGPK
jgi:hypothetical protein